MNKTEKGKYCYDLTYLWGLKTNKMQTPTYIEQIGGC